MKVKRNVVEENNKAHHRRDVHRLSEAESSLLVFVPSEGGVEERSDDHTD